MRLRERAAPPGVLCSTCCGHGTFGDCNDHCSGENCNGTTSLLECAACNIPHHEGFVELRRGLDLECSPVSWCSEYFEEWEEAWSGNTRGTSRGDITIARDP